MSIPLERLYNFLDKIVNVDMIIYHWTPHGSRNLKDLKTTRWTKPWDSLTVQEAVSGALYEYTTPNVVFHDQEPLNYNYWTGDEFVAAFYHNRVPGFKFKNNIDPWIAALHLRSCLLRPGNFFKQTILVHSEKNSKDLEYYTRNNFIGVYYWCHALIARDWFRHAAHDPVLTPNVDNIKYDFLIYNRAWSGTREYRLKFAEMLADQDLIKSSLVKFNPVDNSLHYKNHVFKNKELGITNYNLEDQFELNNHESSASADYNSKDYAQSGIEVVLETLFDDTKIHLTEKTLRSIACGRPFVLASTPGSLKYLRDYGFKTFAPYINEDYDDCDSPLERITAIVAEMKRIKDLSSDKKRELWNRLYEIADYNKKLFFSDVWHDSIVNEYTSNMSLAIEQSKSMLTLEYYNTTTQAQRNSADDVKTAHLVEWEKQSTDWISQNIKQES